jgi:nitroreductase / dihydropteridine reductase
MDIIQSLNWRYATKRMTGEKLPAQDLQTILDAIRLSASSYGLQPYKVLVIENEDLRKQLQPLAYGQAQIVESSHVLVFAAWNSVSEAHVDEYLQAYSTTTGMPIEKILAFGVKDRMMQAIVGMPQDEQYHWAAKQAFIALGTGIVAAASLKIDATPMEGFIPAKVDELLGLSEMNLRSVALFALGYRDSTNDFMEKAPKHRWSEEKFFIKI